MNFVLASRLELLKEVQRLQVKQPYKYFVFVCLLFLLFFLSLAAVPLI